MKRVFNILALLCAVLLLVAVSGYAQTKAVDKSPVPLPQDVANLPTIMAEPWLQVDPGTVMTLEGPSFDRQGNLYVSGGHGYGRLYRITPQKQVTLIYEDKDVEVNGTAFHKDGRLFVVCMSGQLLAMNPDGSNITTMRPLYQGRALRMNDVTFDAKGNLFVTDFAGNISEPTGGVYYVSSDGKTVRPVLRHLCAPNGISLSPNGKVLWVAETSRNGIIRADLDADGVTPMPNQFVAYPYHFTGRSGPDSNRVDSKGNLYQAMFYQGRILIFNENGIPIANVLLPGRDEGKYLLSTSLAIKPGTREGYITANGQGGASIFKFEALAEAVTLFSHQP